MSIYDSDNAPEGDWEERGDLAWNEFDWEQYLREQDRSIRLFLIHYQKCLREPDRVDLVAKEMGWDTDGWAGEEMLVEEPLNEEDILGSTDKAEIEEEYEEEDPYTLQKHPVYIATRAIYSDLAAHWQHLVLSPESNISPQLAAAFAFSLNRGEVNALLAIQALDLGDVALTVSQLKRAMDQLNPSLAIAHSLGKHPQTKVREFQEFALIRLFDLREIWLRVMRDCREELGRRFNDDHS